VFVAAALFESSGHERNARDAVEPRYGDANDERSAGFRRWNLHRYAPNQCLGNPHAIQNVRDHPQQLLHAVAGIQSHRLSRQKVEPEADTNLVLNGRR